MITIYQGETLTFDLSGEDLSGYEVRAALRPSGTSFRRDCTCGSATLMWCGEDMDTKEIGNVVWSLTTEQSASLPVGKYAMEVALRDTETQQDIKESTIAIIEVIQSYTR